MSGGRSPDDDRIVDARERFQHLDGVAGQVLVPEVARSWERSRQLGLSMSSRAVFDEVSRSRRQQVQERNQHLIEFAVPEMERLLTALSRSDWVLACVDATGSVVASLSSGDPHADLRSAFRPGVDLAEQAIGTSAPGCALAEDRPVAVLGNEHYLRDLANFSCIAVPIYGPDGRAHGALDASCARNGNPMMAMEPVFVAARAVENRMLHAIPDALRLGFHYRDDMLGSPMEGVIALSPDGRLLGMNQVARRLLGVDALSGELLFDNLFETGFGSLRDRLRSGRGEPVLLHHRDGLRVSVRSRESERPLRIPVSRPAIDNEAGAECDKPTDAILGRALGLAHNAQAHDIPVLIGGETGTGKDVLARRIHDQGERAQAPFVAINCSAIPAGLIESELFGYEDGAFSGGRRGGASGRFEQANGGTLFLDEIGDMPLDLQARLLRVLQDRRVTRVGGTRQIALDLRIICATHRDLRSMVAQGQFREDLYYRINGLRITLPPLRERPDLPELIHSQLAQATPAGHAVAQIDDEAMAMLLAYRWPGNLRQLNHVMRLATMLAGPGACIEAEHLHEDLRDELHNRNWSFGAGDDAGGDAVAVGSLQLAERQAVAAALASHGGNVSAAARDLGISRETLYRKMRAFGLGSSRQPSD